MLFMKCLPRFTHQFFFFYLPDFAFCCDFLFLPFVFCIVLLLGALYSLNLAFAASLESVVILTDSYSLCFVLSLY